MPIVVPISGEMLSKILVADGWEVVSGNGDMSLHEKNGFSSPILFNLSATMTGPMVEAVLRYAQLPEERYLTLKAGLSA